MHRADWLDRLSSWLEFGSLVRTAYDVCARGYSRLGVAGVRRAGGVADSRIRRDGFPRRDEWRGAGSISG